MCWINGEDDERLIFRFLKAPFFVQYKLSSALDLVTVFPSSVHQFSSPILLLFYRWFHVFLTIAIYSYLRRVYTSSSSTLYLVTVFPFSIHKFFSPTLLQSILQKLSRLPYNSHLHLSLFCRGSRISVSCFWFHQSYD